MEIGSRASLYRRFLRIKRDFKRLWKNYLFQSFLAMFVVFIVFLLLAIEHAVVIASIGATAFIVFTMPRNVTANPRRVVGGHLVGLFSGTIATVIQHYTGIYPIAMYSLAVGLAIFLMVALDFEHPPAGGTALGIALTGFSPGVMMAVLTGSILLAVAHRYSKKYLKDLT